jgi:uncharacterized glyoxalase superfamily protein PhnB
MENASPVFTVKAIRAAIDWYEQVLLFEAVYLNEQPGKEDSLNYAVLRNGNVGLHLGLDRDMENEPGQGACNFDTRDFDDLLQRARDADANFFVEPGTIPTGQRTFGIKDPEGNLITFVEIG